MHQYRLFIFQNYSIGVYWYPEVRMNLLKVRKEIERRGLKQRWLAGQIEVHPNTLSRFLTGKTELGYDSLSKLLEILEIKFETLKKKAS